MALSITRLAASRHFQNFLLDEKIMEVSESEVRGRTRRRAGFSSVRRRVIQIGLGTNYRGASLAAAAATGKIVVSSALFDTALSISIHTEQKAEAPN
jgi:hypothetical protein